MEMPAEVYEQVAGTYRRMAQEASYRPAAPSDGMGNIVVPPQELDLEREVREYAENWWQAEDRGEVWIGSCDFPTRPAVILAVEAARCLNAGSLMQDLGVRLLQMAVAAAKEAS